MTYLWTRIGHEARPAGMPTENELGMVSHHHWRVMTLAGPPVTSAIPKYGKCHVPL